ncbi:MEMO1 family [Scheffersomyces amazonensis]|uniref:MEMO1 family n=1 Tax=Scheffersomyces amazonensis TaxID=1078765 RepID=UPI00315D5636
MVIRPATHAGSWYSNNPAKLKTQLEGFFHKAKKLEHSLSQEKVKESIHGARVLIGPHAGFAYSGERLAETFTVWDKSKVKRIFMLGPSHHVYFKNSVLVSQFNEYETPFGNIPVDNDTIDELLSIKSSSKSRGPVFKYMSSEVDEDEHSFEMHAPFIYHATRNLPQGTPKIIPILISGMDDKLGEDLANALLPYLANEENHFVVSSDFCHWGQRFGYSKYIPTKNDTSITELGSNLVDLGMFQRLSSNDLPIHESIEFLDKFAMQIASDGKYHEWRNYITTTGNTICGQKPIGVILRLLELFTESQSQSQSQQQSLPPSFKWIGYSQSNAVYKPNDSSVSYASGYVVL